MGMQDHEHEREQDPASRGGGEETPTYGTSGERAPAEWGASQETPTHGSQDPPAYGAVSPHLPPYRAESPQPPAYHMGRPATPATPATPEHAAGSLQPPLSGAGGSPRSAP